MSFDENDYVLRRVHMKADVFKVCLQHALSTEKEEVMGLLIGEVSDSCSTHFTEQRRITYFLLLRRHH